jgi:hypothetical protein
MIERIWKTKDELLEMFPPKVTDCYFDNVIKPELDYIKTCAGINEEFLGEK